MVKFHDPIRQATYIRQSLANDKMHIGLFLGAGCPVSIKTNEHDSQKPLIPDIVGLTQIICNNMERNDEQNKSFSKIQSHFKIDERNDPTIEDILSHIRSLEQVAGKDIVRGLRSDELKKMDQAICNEISDLMSRTLPNTNTPYHNLASWIGAISRSSAIQIFTTNYDLLMEQALEELRIPFFDGFSGSFHTFFDSYTMEEDDLPHRWVRLWKLHGSINWWQKSPENISRGENLNPDQMRLIHPSHLKYEESRKMPYFAMIDRLRALFKSQCILITCGYSFQDQHINQILMEGLKSNPNTNIFALLYGDLDNYQQAIKLSLVNPNLSLLAFNEAVIGTKRASWMVRNEEILIPNTVESTGKKHKGNMKLAKFLLGDFANFGLFLTEMVGENE